MGALVYALFRCYHLSWQRWMGLPLRTHLVWERWQIRCHEPIHVEAHRCTPPCLCSQSSAHPSPPSHPAPPASSLSLPWLMRLAMTVKSTCFTPCPVALTLIPGGSQH